MTDIIRKYALDVLNANPAILTSNIMPELSEIVAGRKDGKDLYTMLHDEDEDEDGFHWTWLRLFLLVKNSKGNCCFAYL